MRALFVWYGAEQREIHTSVHVGVLARGFILWVGLTGGRT